MLNNIETIRMHFSEMSGCRCGKDPIWKDLPSEDIISISLNLETDQYEFRGYCRGCLQLVLNTRKAFV